ISPAVGSMKPASSRSAVVLPQPEGPSRHTSVPWAISSDTLSRATASPKRLVRPRRTTDDTVPSVGWVKRSADPTPSGFCLTRVGSSASPRPNLPPLERRLALLHEGAAALDIVLAGKAARHQFVRQL